MDLNKGILEFIDRHNVDWVYYASGCETCDYGSVREINCSCGWSGESDAYREHLRYVAAIWKTDLDPITNDISD
jgi:hypothetical protein